MSAVFQLASGVSFCRADGRIVFFHLTRERYFQLTDEQADWFGILTADQGPGDLPHKVAAFAARLEAIGLLQKTSAPSVPIHEHRVQEPSCSAMDFPLKTTPRHPLSLLPGVAGAGFLVWTSLRSKGLAFTLSALRRQKQISQAKVSDDVSASAALATEFLGWSPFLFTSHDACLFRSLALARFLFVRSIPACLVIAVRCQPFRAHAWVQHEGTVLNEHLETARSYSPIYSV
jgi:hypothetical protein